MSTREVIAATFGWDIGEVSDYRYQPGHTKQAIYAVGEHYFAVGKKKPTDLTEYGEVEWELNPDQYWAEQKGTKLWRTKEEVKKPWREDLQYGYKIEAGWLHIDAGVIYENEMSMQLESPKAVKCFSGSGFQKFDIDSIPEPAKTYLIKLYEESLD